MKKPTKKDIIPLITSAVFSVWIIVWLVAIILGKIPISFNSIFYFMLPVPWIVLMVIVWVNWKNISSKILNPEYGKSYFDPLYIKEGLVRLFQIVLVFIVFIYYITIDINNPDPDSIIPIGLLVVVNAILAYFGFTQSDVLPKEYVIESLNVDVPSNKKLLSSLPVVKDAFYQFEIRFKDTLNAIDQLIQKSSMTVNAAIVNIEQRLEDIDKIVNNIPYYAFSRDKFEKYNYLVLIVLLAVINIILQPVFGVPTFIALPTFSIFGILIGVSARNKINGNISNNLLEDINALKKELQFYKKNLEGITTFASELLEDLKQLYNAFMKSNFLEFLPANYSPFLSIGFVSFLSLFIFLLPFTLHDVIFTTMQWFVIYYFTTKQ